MFSFVVFESLRLTFKQLLLRPHSEDDKFILLKRRPSREIILTFVRQLDLRVQVQSTNVVLAQEL